MRTAKNPPSFILIDKVSGEVVYTKRATGVGNEAIRKCVERGRALANRTGRTYFVYLDIAGVKVGMKISVQIAYAMGITEEIHPGGPSSPARRCCSAPELVQSGQGVNCLNCRKWVGGSSRQNPRRTSARRNIFLFNNNPPSGAADETAARELEIYVENDSALYRQQFIPIVKNLMLKRRKGTYNRELAVKLFMYLMDAGAKKYIAEFGTRGAKIDTVFNRNTRIEAARTFRDSFEAEAELGNYDRLIGPVSNPRGVRKNIFLFNNPGHICDDDCRSYGCRAILHRDTRPPARRDSPARRAAPVRQLNAMERAASLFGLYVTTWAPGDGLTRYRFHTKPADYSDGTAIYTANGRGEALKFLKAYGVGRSRMNPKSTPTYVIEGFTHRGRRGHSQRRAEFKTASLGEARARAEQIFKETGVVVVIAQRNPLTVSEGREIAEEARREALIGGQINKSPGSRGFHLGRSDGMVDVVRKYGPDFARQNPACSNPIIRGDRLPHHLKQRVLASFIYRWTSGNARRESVWRGISGKPRIPLISDEQWLREHAFHVTKAGTLDARHHHAEPAFMADGTRPNPLLQTIMLANPPLAAQWDRLTGRQRQELLELSGDNLSTARRSWSSLSTSTQRMLERNWLDTSASRGTTQRRMAPVGVNPLTDEEAERTLKYARGSLSAARRYPEGSLKSFRAGEAHGQAIVVHDRASEKFYPKARKIFKDSYAAIGIKSNPGTLRLPAPGTKMTVAQAMELARRIGNKDLIEQCRQAAALQSKANSGAKSVTWKHLPLGSKTKVEAVVAMVHYGDSPEDMYRPPKGSKKGPHMYRHSWGEGTGKKRPVQVLAAPGGKAIIKLMGPGQKVGDWMRG